LAILAGTRCVSLSSLGGELELLSGTALSELDVVASRAVRSSAADGSEEAAIEGTFIDALDTRELLRNWA